MEKINQFFEEMGMNPVLLIDEDTTDIKELIKFANELVLSNKEDRIKLLYSFSFHYDGFFLKDWKRFIHLDEITEEVEEQAKELIYSVTMRFEEIGDDFYFDVDLDYLDNIVNSDIFGLREDGLEKLVVSWGLRRTFVNQRYKDEEIQKLITELVKQISDEHQFYQKIYNTLPELIKNAKI